MVSFSIITTEFGGAEVRVPDTPESIDRDIEALASRAHALSLGFTSPEQTHALMQTAVALRAIASWQPGSSVTPAPR